VRHRERQPGRHLFGLVPGVMTCRHDSCAQIGERFEALSVAV
jgi:hypothetical protein